MRASNSASLAENSVIEVPFKKNLRKHTWRKGYSYGGRRETKERWVGDKERGRKWEGGERFTAYVHSQQELKTLQCISIYLQIIWL